MTITIIGAGLSGLIAGRMLGGDASIVEAASLLPNNHRAILRFRTEAVSLATNIPFRKVRVIKAVAGSGNPVRDANQYALKVIGKLQPRSIINIDPVDRFIAPPDFINQLASHQDITYLKDTMIDDHLASGVGHLISTIPMLSLMQALDWSDRPIFGWSPGWSAVATINPELVSDAYCTIYFPGDEPFYRASITGDKLIVEGVGPAPEHFTVSHANDMVNKLLWPFGLWPSPVEEPTGAFVVSPARYAKITPHAGEDKERAKRFIMWASKEFNIHSLGRFATWRPGLLLDDIVNDVRVINRLIDGFTPWPRS